MPSNPPKIARKAFLIFYEVHDQKKQHMKNRPKFDHHKEVKA
jgi:hypothetical protein